MNYVDVKNSILTKQLGDTPIIFCYHDNTFVIDQYLQEVSRIFGRKLEYIDSLDSLKKKFVDIFGTQDLDKTIRVLRCDEFDSVDYSLYQEKFLYIVTKKVTKQSQEVFKNFICEIPKLETWELKDYAYSFAEGVDVSDLDWLVDVCNSDIYRLANEISKLSIFEENERKYVFDALKSDGNYNDLSQYSVFDVTNSVASRDLSKLRECLLQIKAFDVEPLGIVTILYKQFQKMIKVMMAANPTPQSTGLSSGAIYAIKQLRPYYTNSQLLQIYRFLLNIDFMLKTGKINTSWLIDYVICRILTL